MLSKIPRILWVVVPLALVLYLYRLDGAGLLGADEPRYASISREMSRSGDWVTPRLWGQPWFEKPALLYWISGAAFRLGLGPELAPRLPVALIALAFLGFYWWILNREFGCRPATIAALILGSSAAWIGYSQVAVPDMLLSATFSAAMLLTLPWIDRRETRLLPAASAFLGLAVLAKGLVPLALALPVLVRWRNLRELLQHRAAAPFLIVAVPWYLACYLINGRVFLDEFFIKHHWQRIVSDSLMHVQPWWYYLPVLAGLLIPWTPLAALLIGRRTLREPRRLFLIAWVLFGLVFLSAAVNKLPGYVLPLAPAIAALMGIALDEADNPRPWLAACGILLVCFLVISPVAASAVSGGLSHIEIPAFQWTWVLPAIPTIAAVLLDARGKRIAAVLSIACGAAAGVLFLKSHTAADLDRAASARSLWMEVRAQTGAVCVDNIGRAWRYGLNYYSVIPLPDCSVEAKPLRIRQAPGQPPQLVSVTASGDSR